MRILGESNGGGGPPEMMSLLVNLRIESLTGRSCCQMSKLPRPDNWLSTVFFRIACR